MIKPSYLIFVIIAILALGYFAHSCDGSVVLAGSGPDIPPGDGLNWLDVGGSDWINLDKLDNDMVCCLVLAPDHKTISPSIGTAEFITVMGNQIRYGLRFDPMITSSSEKSAVRMMASGAIVCPLIEGHSYRGDLYILDRENSVGISSGSDLREDREYVYLEFNNIPPSSTGKYAFVLGPTNTNPLFTEDLHGILLSR